MLVRRVTLLVLSLCVFSPYVVWAEEAEAVSPVLSSQAVQALREAKTVRLVVNVSNPDYLSAAEAAKLCKRLLGYAGLQVVEAENAEADVQIVVEARLKALSANYSSSPLGYGPATRHWTGAAVSGSVRLIRDRAQLGIFTLEGEDGCTPFARPHEQLSPAGAPFQEVFTGAFAKAWWPAAGKVWGSAVLIAAFKDHDWHVREHAREALRELGNAAVEPLIAALKDDGSEVRLCAMMVLGEFGDARAVEPLIAALKDKDDNVRKAAAETLGELGDVRAVEPLIAALKDENRFVRKAAAKALKAITRRDFGTDQQRWKDWWDESKRGE